MANQILVIAPYWLESVANWVFDDEAVDLFQEPFVSGVPEMIDELVADIPNARWISVVFSAAPFPGFRQTDPSPGRLWRLVVFQRRTRCRRLAVPGAVSLF